MVRFGWFKSCSFLTMIFLSLGGGVLFLNHLCFATTNGTLDPKFDAMEIFPHIRTYVSGPIDAQMLPTKHDSIALSAGPLPPLDDPEHKVNIRKWVLYGDADNVDSLCFLQKIYDYGVTAIFQCPIAGTYVGYTMDAQQDRIILTAALERKIGVADNPQIICDTRRCLKFFDLTDRFKSESDEVLSDEHIYKNFLEIRNEIVAHTQSDPIDITDSDFCYYWNYRMEQKARVGFVFRESEPRTGVAVDGSYLIMEVVIWVVEHNSMTESERNPSLDNLVIGEYSKLLTQKFHAKGLLPCIRKVHPSVELSSDVVYVNERDSKLRSPHWKLELKIHTDTLVSTISDITFTIASRQHIALFHCFVGDMRVFVNIRDFDFIDESQSDRNQVNWEISRIGKTREEFLKLKIKHIYGHGTVYAGQASSRNYQPGDSRTDMVIITNPCVAQEFAFATGGRIYIAEQFLKEYQADVIDLVVPGLTFIDAEDSGSDPVETNRRHHLYLKVADVAFTPTHVAILMQDSSIYLHSHSIFYKGLAFLTETKKFRIGALVKRRWCARTGTPKTHNMILPGYSPRGDIIIIQVYPTEGSATLLISNPAASCLVKDGSSFKKSRAEIIQENVNESCIHSDELVVVSDERGLFILPDDLKEECLKKTGESESTHESSKANPDELRTYLQNHGELFPATDPHFPKELTNVAIHKIQQNSTYLNLAIIFEVDRGGDKLKNVLSSHGIVLTPEPLKLHSVEFTSVEKMYIVGVVFEAKELAETTSAKGYAFTMMITTVTAINQPHRLDPEAEKEEDPLLTTIPFPGVLIVRGMPYMVASSSKDPKATADPYITKIYPMNTAMPAYVVDLGNVFVFTSVEGKYARPLSYFPREKIHEVLREIKGGTGTKTDNILQKGDRTPVFAPKNYDCKKINSCLNPSNQLFDIVVSEQGTVSVLRRRASGSNDKEGQRVYIGSVLTLDSLREVQPFVSDDQIFQFTTPDGEIVYGKYTVRGMGFFRNCTEVELANFKQDTGESCFAQAATGIPFCTKHDPSIPLPIAPTSCKEWTFVNETKATGSETPNVIGFCPVVGDRKCVHKGADGLIPPENYPIRELNTAEILGVQFHSLLNGNLQLVTEEKITDSTAGITGGGITKNKEDQICPFVNFDVTYLKFDFAEVGFSTRISATISYLGKNVPSEAQLIVEYENVPGIQVLITSGVVKEKDETTLTKTLDITMTLTDGNLRRMKTEKIRTGFRDKKNLAREIADMFSVTIRPSIINLRCKKEDFYTTLQYNIGCNSFNEMRLIAPASPLIKKTIRAEFDQIDNTVDWRREGDFLTVPRESIWHKQRVNFECGEDDRCKIPYAYLYDDRVYDLSWRDPFVPQFEQILSGHVRRVTGNVVVYDLLGHKTFMNVSQQDAACNNIASISVPSATGNRQVQWYDSILDSTTSIGKKASEREDVYQYFSDCYDTSVLSRASAFELSTNFYHLINRTNFNRIRFDISKGNENFKFENTTKNRNQILIFRAVVVNTHFNRFTYCKLMDTFFLIRVTGSPAPRQGLQRLDAAIVIFLLVIFFGVIYLFFYKFCTWKLDIPAIPGGNQEDVDPEEAETQWTAQFGKVESDHMMKRLAVKVHAVAKWRQKALMRVVKRFKDTPSQKPDWAKARLAQAKLFDYKLTDVEQRHQDEDGQAS